MRMTQDGNQIIIRVVRPEYTYVFAYTKGPQVNFEIHVPSETSMRLVTSSSGDITLIGLSEAGDLEVETDF